MAEEVRIWDLNEERNPDRNRAIAAGDNTDDVRIPLDVIMYGVNVLEFGADPTGVADSTEAIQSAINEAKGGTLYMPQGLYVISDTLVFYTSQKIRGAASRGGTAVNGQGVIIKAAAGFSGTYISQGNTTVASDPDYGGTQHWLQVFNITFNCDGKCSGFNVGAMGEESLFQSCRFEKSTGPGLLMEGTAAIGHIFDCSAWDCLDYGFKCTSATSADIRFFGISGDSNRPGLFYTDGGFQQIYGIKAENRVDAADAGAIVIDTVGTGGARPHLLIQGGRFDPAAGGGVAGGAFVTITGTGSPHVEMQACHTPLVDNLLDDQVNSFTVPYVSGGIEFIDYCADGDSQQLRASKTDTVRATTHYRYPAIGSTTIDSRKETTNAAYRLREIVAVAGDFWRVMCESGDTDIFTVARNVTGGVLLWKWGEDSTPVAVRPSRIVLASAPTLASDGSADGASMWISDGRKPSEGAGSGTGVPANWSGGPSGYTWYSNYDGLEVAS